MWNKRPSHNLVQPASREQLSLHSALLDAVLALTLLFMMSLSPFIGFLISIITRISLGPSFINVICCIGSIFFGMRAANTLSMRQAAHKAALEQQKLKSGQRKLMGLEPTAASSTQEAPRHLSLPPNRVMRLLLKPWSSKPPAPAPGTTETNVEPSPAPLTSPFLPQGHLHASIATLDQIQPFLNLLAHRDAKVAAEEKHEEFYNASEYYPPHTYSDDMNQDQNPLVMLPMGPEAPTYRNTWWRQGEARRGEARQGESLTPSSMDIVDDFTESIIGVVWSNRLVEAWVDNLREWLSFKVLKPLVAAVRNAHVEVNQVLEHYQSLQQQQQQQPLGQASPQAAQMFIRLPSLADVLASEGGGPPVSSFFALLSPTQSSPLQQPPPQQQQQGLDIDSGLRYAQGLCQSLSFQPVHQANALVLAKALVRYSSLLSLVKGKTPSDLLPPTPPGYCWSRIQALAEGSCLPCYQWAGGGNWGLGFQPASSYSEGGKPWTPDLPTDSSLILYLFAAFVESPGWDFPLESTPMMSGPSPPPGAGTLRSGGRGPGMPLYLGHLPPRAPQGQYYSAILTFKPDKPSPQADAILALNMASSVPLHCFMAQGRVVALTGYQACFHSILMFVLYHQRNYNGALGAYYLDDPALALSPVIAFQGR